MNGKYGEYVSDMRIIQYFSIYVFLPKYTK